MHQIYFFIFLQKVFMLDIIVVLDISISLTP